MTDFDSAKSPAADAPEECGVPSARRTEKHYLMQEGVLYLLPHRAYRKLLASLQPGAPIPPLGQFGKPLGPLENLDALPAQAQAAKDRRRTTGNFATREELLYEVWSLRLLSKLSDSFIARRVGISTKALDKILMAQEGRPANWGPSEGFKSVRFRGLVP